MTADMDGALPLPTGRVELLGPEPEEAQSDALELARDLESIFVSEDISATYARKIAAELRRLATVEAERDRMREALESLVNADPLYEDQIPSRLWDQARAALTPDRS